MSATPVVARPGFADPSFGRDGIVELDVEPTGSNLCDAIAIDPKGRILVLTRSAGDRSTLLRLTSRGRLDRSFGNAGKVALTGGPWSALAVGGDGRIEVAGAWDGAFFVARYGRSGLPDPGFGGGTGMVVERVDPGFAAPPGGELQVGVSKLALDTQGSGVVLGYAKGYRSRFQQYRRDLVMRFLPDGQPDMTFGDGSAAFLTPLRSHSLPPRPFYFSSLAALGDGRLLVGGDIDGRLAVLRLAADGRLDDSWGGDGIVVSSLETAAGQDGIGGNEGEARAVLIQARGRIVAVGKYSLLGLRPDGSRDRSFGRRGRSFPTGYVGPFPKVEDATLDSRGRVLATGNTRSRTAIVRFRADGGLDRRFGRDGIALLNVSHLAAKVDRAGAHESSTSIAVDSRDRPVTAGPAFVNRKHAVLALTRVRGGGGRRAGR